ncbi:MAG: CesT family type III secretion system chaperone [Candidatus Rhabdochlamydia sp.]
MMDPFAQLLNDLSLLLDTHLSPDKRGACKLNIEDALHIQLEPDANREKLLFFSFLSEIPPGKFRENVLRDALKANADLSTPGTLGFSERNNQLVLFANLNLHPLTAKEVLDFLHLFMAKAQAWKQGIATGQTSNLCLEPLQKPLSPFDLKP